jgi:hypothetical protein
MFKTRSIILFVNRDHRSSLNILGSGTTYTLW